MAGIRIDSSSYGYFYFNRFLTKAEFSEVLTLITGAYQSLVYSNNRKGAEYFRSFVSSAFAEENLAFRVDDECIVHFSVDEEFERNRNSTIAVLCSPKLNKAQIAFENAFKSMNESNTKAAILSIFEAVEIVARQLAPNHKNLHAGLARGELKAICLEIIATDDVSSKSLEKQFESLSNWVDSVHFYRHGQPQGAPPTGSFAVLVLSMGCAYLRLLGEVYLLKEANSANHD